MEISIVILSCVILGLNPEMPVFIRLIWIPPNKIHTYNRTMVDLEQHTQPAGSTAVFQGSPA